MSPESPCWQKLKERSTLLTNEQCLLDLDKRLQILEAGHPSSLTVRPASSGALADSIDGAPTPDLGGESERLPDIAPIPVSQRLPEVHELDREGRCWAYRNTSHEPLGKAWILGTPVSLQLTRPWCTFTHWLPHWSLPIVVEPDEDG
jgi:hypothetical protein